MRQRKLLVTFTIAGIPGGKLRGSGGNRQPLAKLSNLWQAVAMGNKDARRREVRKPPKKKPPKHVVNQTVTQISYKPPTPKP
jgi:hypothetical protein